MLSPFWTLIIICSFLKGESDTLPDNADFFTENNCIQFNMTITLSEISDNTVKSHDGSSFTEYHYAV
ncbi:Uncharacterised protein [Sphingobacterium spiritivorum]|nr:Uncharacterised protein [Sphingobacterium spiritivorum]